MEVGGTDTIFTAPRHPYTAGLINSIPQRGQPLQGVPGTIFDLRTPPPGSASTRAVSTPGLGAAGISHR